MEGAQGWRWLVEEGERRCLVAWTLASARGIPLQGTAPAPLVEVGLLPQNRPRRGAHCRHPERARGRGGLTGGQCEPRPEQRPEILAGGGRQIAGQKVFLTVNQTRH